MAAINVTAGPSRQTPREQIQRIIDLVRAEGPTEEVRLRLPLNIFDPEASRNYTQIRDAFWNLRLPAASTEVSDVEAIIEALTKFTAALGERGADAVIRVLEHFEDPT